MEWEAALGAYGMVTAMVVAVAVAARVKGDLNNSPLAYVFWPIIALTACIVTVKRMWRDG